MIDRQSIAASASCAYLTRLLEMSVCSTAVGLLAAMAALHFTITIVLGVIVAFVLHLRKRSQILKHQQQIAETTRALVAAGRTISPSDAPSDHKKDSKVLDVVSLEASGEIAALEVDKIESDEKAELSEENFANPWMGKIKISADHDDSEVVLRKGARSSNTSSDKSSDPLRRIGSPLELIRTGSPLVRTGSPLARTGSPLVRTTSPMDDMRRKARASVISIASNISNRFRKSVDLNEEEVEKLVSMSTIIDSSSDSNSEEGILAISGDDKVDGCDINGIDDDNDNDNRSNAGDHGELELGTRDGSTMKLKIDFPWESASESTC